MGTGTPRLISTDGVTSPRLVPHGERSFDEQSLQLLLADHPSLIPLEEIGTSWGPLVSIGREVAVRAGFIDNLFLSPSGEVTVVETKLWRNPQSRREVVGQVLDYAASLQAMSYEELDEAVRECSEDERTLWDRVPHDVGGYTEAQFIDTVSRNLRLGRFLLLVVGDGIREDLESLAELLRRQPHLGFHLELVELRMYDIEPTGDTLVVPTVVGRTAEIERAVVRIDYAAKTTRVDPPTNPPSSSGGAFVSVADFVAHTAEQTGDPDRAEAIGALVEEWRQDFHGLVKLNKTSINLSARYRHTPGKSVSVATLFSSGKAQGSIDPIVNWREIAPFEVVRPIYEHAGFSGDPLWPSLDLHPQRDDHRLAMRELFAAISGVIESADKSPTGVAEL